MSATEAEDIAVDEDHGAVPVGGEFVSDEQRKEYVTALLTEKTGYERRVKAVAGGKKDPYTEAQLQDRVDQVDKELARVGHGGKTARKRAEAR